MMNYFRCGKEYQKAFGFLSYEGILLEVLLKINGLLLLKKEKVTFGHTIAVILGLLSIIT